MSDHRPPNFADPRNVIDPGRKDSLATWMAFYGMLEDTTDRYTTRSDWAKAPADEAFIHAAIRLRALSAASVPLRVYVRSGHDLTPADLTEDKDAKELQELLDFVNPDTMSSSDLKATLVSSLSIYGEAYLLKTRGRLGGRPKELHFLNPAAVTPKMGDRWIDEYVYQPVGRQQTATYNPKDVIAFRVPGNFVDPTRGLSPINAVRMEIGTSRMATEHTNSQLRNQGVPAGVWVAPKDSEITTQDQSTIKRVLASLRGPKNAGKTAVLPGGLEWRSLGFSEKDAQYLMARKVSRMAIGAALGVPLALLGDDEHTGVYRSTRDAEQVFWRRLTEELNWMAQIIDSWLTSEYDKTGQRLTVRFDTSAVEALRPTIMEQSSLWQMMLSMGIVTTNEARAHFGVGAPVEWGNVPVRSGGLAPIGVDGMPVMPAAPAAPGAPAPEGPQPAQGKEPAVVDAMTPEDESDDPEVQPLTPTVSSWQGFGGSSQSGLPKGKKHGDGDQSPHGNRDGAGDGEATIVRTEPHFVKFQSKGGAQVSISVNERHRDKPPKVMGEGGKRIRMPGLGKDGLPTPENMQALAAMSTKILDATGMKNVSFEVNNEEFTSDPTVLGNTNNWAIISLRSWDMSDEEVRDTVAHELGHVLDDKNKATQYADVRDALDDHEGLLSISFYAANGVLSEAYAETFMSFMTGRYKETQMVLGPLGFLTKEKPERTETRIKFVEKVAAVAGWKKP